MSGSDYGRFDELRQSGLGEVEADRQLYNDGMQFIREHPRDTMVNFGRKLKVWFTPTTQSFGPSIWLIVIAFMAAAYWRHGVRDQRPPLRRWLVAIAMLLALVAYFAWCNSEGYLPLASAIFLLPLGIPCLLIAPMPHQTKWLLMGIVLSQLAVALLYIPLSRLRWSIDAIFIIAVAIACSQLCGLIDGREGAESPPPKNSPGA
jgi:hypothetical protein